MKYFRSAGLYWRTVKHLKFVQIYTRLLRRFSAPRHLKAPINPVVRVIKQVGFLEQTNSSLIDLNRFRFLNREEELDFPDDWNNRSLPTLWMYNLHYFDFLLCSDTPLQLKNQMIEKWISENAPCSGLGWEPYPSSLRLVNWIKWGWLSGKLTPHAVSSLYEQTLVLEQQLEFHLLGNHLLENAKALVFAGTYFDDEVAARWLDKGLRILTRELDEQILDDGAHFELSPMYHSIMLELVSDIALLSQNEASPTALQERQDLLKAISLKMAGWLKRAIHPDGQVSFFNDSVVGIAKHPLRLIEYSQTVADKKIDDTLDNINGESGLAQLERGRAVVFFDVGPIGPEYLPGHAHADSLSIEMSLFGRRLFVNGGVSQYGISDQREKERGTAAHSTLEIAGQNSSETWSGFRVGRRAKVHGVKVKNTRDSVIVAAEHDGYCHLEGQPRHKRQVALTGGQFVVEDTVNETRFVAKIRFHLHPDIQLEVDESGKRGRFLFDDGSVAHWHSLGNRATVESFNYSPKFGITLKSKTLVFDCSGQVFHRFEVKWAE